MKKCASPRQNECAALIKALSFIQTGDARFSILPKGDYQIPD